MSARIKSLETLSESARLGSIYIDNGDWRGAIACATDVIIRARPEGLKDLVKNYTNLITDLEHLVLHIANQRGLKPEDIGDLRKFI